MFFRKTRRELAGQKSDLAEREKQVAHDRAEIDERLATLELLVSNRVDGYAHIAQAWADWEEVRAERSAQQLLTKRHPAPTAAEVVREKGHELSEMRRRMKVAEYVTALYEFHFPWLTEFRDIESEFDYVGQETGDESKSDPVHGDLSTDEWATLTTSGTLGSEVSIRTPFVIPTSREASGCRSAASLWVPGEIDIPRAVKAWPAPADRTLSHQQIKANPSRGGGAKPEVSLCEMAQLPWIHQGWCFSWIFCVYLAVGPESRRSSSSSAWPLCPHLAHQRPAHLHQLRVAPHRRSRSPFSTSRTRTTTPSRRGETSPIHQAAAGR